MKEQEIWKVYKVSDPQDVMNKARWGKRVYEVSNLGNVRINGELVDFSKYVNKPGYLGVGNFYVHRAVAELFVHNPENNPEVDHINRNKHDNRAENLRWVTRKENAQNRADMHGKNNPMYGHIYTEEELKAQSERSKKNMQDPKIRAKCASRKNKKMMTDGTVKILVHKDHWGEFIDIGFRFTCERSILNKNIN